MRSTQQATRLIVVVCLVAMAPLIHAQPGAQSEREAIYARYLKFPSLVKGSSIEPHWMADGSSFWYAEGAPESTIIYTVDPKANSKTPLFDTARLRKALTPLLGHEPPFEGLPFEQFTFVDDDEKAVKFTVQDQAFTLRLDSYKVTAAPSRSEEERQRMIPQIVRRTNQFDQERWRGTRRMREKLSPDRRWFALTKEHNLWLRSSTDDTMAQLTTDGSADYAWNLDAATWSPDSTRLAVKRIDRRGVPKMPIVRWLDPQQDVKWISLLRAGGPLPQLEVWVMDIPSGRRVRLETGRERDEFVHVVEGNYILGWRPDGSELVLLRSRRGQQKVDVLAAHPTTGASRVVLTETTPIYFPTWLGERFFTLLKDGERFIWLSERDGWNHLYLYDLNGNLIRRLTQGNFPVVRVVTVDEHAGWVYFTAQGDQQRPYDIHLYRVSLTGKGFTRLSEAIGEHDIVLAPSKAYFLDTHSSVTRPPQVDLRRADGTLLQTLATANIDALKELGWTPPEEFKVKAGDGETDLWGVLYKPYDFDPTKKYPVLEEIYGGAWRSPVDRRFIPDLSAAAMAQIGFLVFMADGRGTPGRGRAFQAVGRGRVAQVIPEHVAILKHLAAERPYIDLSRVGIYGHSNGGYYAIRAMLQAPEFYQVGVASAPGGDEVDSYLGEYWMGLPEENPAGYKEASNTLLAGNLKGKLLLVHGTSDPGVPFAGTMKMVEALVQAGKRFDLMVLPEQGHGFRGASSAYFREARYRYFQEHLQHQP